MRTVFNRASYADPSLTCDDRNSRRISSSRLLALLRLCNPYFPPASFTQPSISTYPKLKTSAIALSAIARRSS